jgi:phosphoglycolate phosphatase
LSALARQLHGQLPRLVMFDLDGTLLDSVPDLAAATDLMLEQLGREPAGVEQVRDWVGNGSLVLVRRALASSIEHASVDADEAAAAHRRFLEIYADCHALSRVYPGVRECLDWLRGQGAALGLVTNKPFRFIEPLLTEHGLHDYFAWVLGGDSLEQHKPDPAPLQWMLARADVEADQALFVGDSRSDVLAAQAAGVACIAVSYGYNHGRPVAEENPLLVLDDLRQLVDSLRGLG